MPSQDSVDIPVQRLTDRAPLPQVCVAHGLPAVRRVDFVVRSKPDIGSRKKVFQPGYTSLNRAEEYTRQVQLVRVAGWPLCPRCTRQRTVGLTLAAVLFFAGLAAIIAGFVIGALDDGTDPALLVPILAGFAAMLLSPVPLVRAALPRITHTELHPDTAVVRVNDPSAPFADQLDHLT